MGRFLLIGLILAAPAMAAPAVSADGAKEKDKLICRREVPIGSLIASRKVCLTQTQWTQREVDGNTEARRVVEAAAGRCGGNGGLC
jgi:predicted secreted protein